MIALLFALALQSPADKGFATTKEAMQKVQLVIGDWKGSGVPEDSKDPSWEEKASWNFRIDKDTFSLVLTVTDGRLAKDATLTYDLKKKVYRLDLARPDGAKIAYEGRLADRTLALDQVVEGDGDQERLEFNLLRDNRFFVNVERRRAGARAWNLAYNLGYTKEGVPFVRGERPKCVVTGGLGTQPVAYGGQTYYVC